MAIRNEIAFSLGSTSRCWLIHVEFFGPSHTKLRFLQRLQIGRVSSGFVSTSAWANQETGRDMDMRSQHKKLHRIAYHSESNWSFQAHTTLDSALATVRTAFGAPCSAYHGVKVNLVWVAEVDKVWAFKLGRKSFTESVRTVLRRFRSVILA